MRENVYHIQTVNAYHSEIVMANELVLQDKVKLFVDIAGVHYISYAVPVTFRLKFLPSGKISGKAD
ncbi:hypothetical protein [Parendozoicomonas sp. Alg238-R29]|uniref:hypothetical protein n=1 Tax=Parendozoicomonas sp. Alg238-R29 TaxID=2993446 RepID=UPI00248EE9D9|nr:hypothetical protein [Parendozoicomonas sp. Alg238-R29]